MHLQKLNESGTQLNGDSIKIAVLDTGCFIHHDSFKDKLSQVKVYNFVKDSSHQTLPPVTAITSPRNHCTAIVSLIFKVAPKATVYIMRIAADSSPSKTESKEEIVGNLFDALKYINEKMDDQIRPDIISLSFGFHPILFKNSIECKKIIDTLETKHTICVAAAGNEGAHQESIPLPAQFSNVISVGSLNRHGRVSDFTPDSPDIDVHAYGEKLKVPCLPANLDESLLDKSSKVDQESHRVQITNLSIKTDSNSSSSGTSLATPMFAGLLALLFQYGDVKVLSGEKCTKLRNCFQIKHIVHSHIQPTMREKILLPYKFFGNVERDRNLRYLFH